NVPASHWRPARTISMCISRVFRNWSKSLNPDVSPVSPENLNRDQGRLAISTELRAANSHSLASLRPTGSAGIRAPLRSPRCSRIAPLSKIEIAIGQPRDLAEGLVREMLDAPSTKRHALDAVGQGGF